MDVKESLKTTIRALPNNPGIYQFFDKDGVIIYVGKAKNIKKRVSSYFNKENSSSGKTRILVAKICDIKFIVVDTEIDALLLENNLIKKYQPRYNIQLKDDKTYPWICIKKEPFPRVFSTRNVVKDGSQYFGPFASVKIMNAVLDLIRKLYQLRNCNFNLAKEKIEANKYKVCLEHHLGNCNAPCVGKETEEEYDITINHIREILKGNLSTVSKYLKGMMEEHVAKLEYEKAQIINEKITLLDKFQVKSTVVSPTINNVDVISLVSDEKNGYANYLKVMNGAIIQGHTIEMTKKLDESDEQLLTLAITELRSRFESNAKEIIIPFKIETEFPDIKLFVPQRGDKHHLLDLSRRNAQYYRMDKLKQANLVDPQRHSKRILEQLKTDLKLTETPVHIECFDNSNFQGSYPVAAMTVFKNAKPSKKDYRHFNIKTVEGPNDFASMEEVIYRRYKRVLDEKQSLPQVIIVDGGKGQLSSAMISIKKLGLENKVCVIGIAKKLEEIYFANDPVPLYLDKRSESLQLIQQLRDEAHRFGITHHRKKRDKGTLKTELTSIDGISDKSAQRLLSHFKSVKKIKQSSEEEIAAIIGKAKAKKIVEAYTK